MAAYQSFTTARGTEPDAATLIINLRALDASAGVQHMPGSTTYVIKKATAWTGPQITAAQSVIDTSPVTSSAITFAATSRQKDVLTTCALIVRAQGVAAWNAMTTPQKIAAATAQADIWATIRQFVEDNLP